MNGSSTPAMSKVQTFSAAASCTETPISSGASALLVRNAERHVILFVTAIVELESEAGRSISARALLDPG